MAKYLSNVMISRKLTTSDPVDSPVHIIGLLKYLKTIRFEEISKKLASRVSKEEWNYAVSQLSTSPTDTCPLYQTHAAVSALPEKCSRHNTPSRSHSITKLVKSHFIRNNETIVLVCDKSSALASACAVARAASCYCKKTTAIKESNIKIEFLLVDPNPTMNELDAQAIADTCKGVMLAACIVDIPANEMHTDGFIEEIEKVGSILNIEPIIIRGEELEQRGFGGIYGVGKASTRPPALVILSHKPEGAKENIAWVGKGIVFDTGGLSMKTKITMPGMKRDCAGAAGVLGAFYTTVQTGFSENLHAIFCLAENAVGPTATRPDDIHTMYSGRTVEINNTDAEGRLVLSDGVAYAAKDLQCTTIVDMATLTSAQGASTGRYHGAVLTNTEAWEQKSVLAGKNTGDLLHPIVFAPELHFSEFSSSVADMKNSVLDRANATSSCAGLFIFSHLGFEFPGTWIHIDMASPAYSGERATGYGAALLLGMFSQYSSSTLIKALSQETSEENHCSYKKPRLH